MSKICFNLPEPSDRSLFGEEAVDGRLQIDDEVENAALEPSSGEPSEEAEQEVGVKWKVTRS